MQFANILTIVLYMVLLLGLAWPLGQYRASPAVWTVCWGLWSVCSTGSAA